MHFKVQECNTEIEQVLYKLKEENEKNTQLARKVVTQDLEVRTLLETIDTLRKQVIKFTHATTDPLKKYDEHDEMMLHYKDSESIMNKLKNAKHTAIKSDLLDM
jgi:hypothetical protein